MYVAPYFLIAFAVNFGLLVFFGWASDEPLWAEDARLLGCAVYAAGVGLVFSLTGLSRANQGQSVSVQDVISSRRRFHTREVPLEVPREANERPSEPANEPVMASQRPSLVPSPEPVKGELATWH